MRWFLHCCVLGALVCYHFEIISSEDATTHDDDLDNTTATLSRSSFTRLTKDNGNESGDYTLLEAFPSHIKTAFFISATTTLCVLLSCSFLIGLYEVYDRKKQKPVKTHA